MGIDYKLIGQRLAKCRKEKHITQEQLAEYLDVSTAFISRIECGRTQINLERLVQICHFLEIEPSYILQGADCASPVYMNGPSFSASVPRRPFLWSSASWKM